MFRVIYMHDEGKRKTFLGGRKKNKKTLKQIEEMKQQTIGVEIEMNNITRKEAAGVVAKDLSKYKRN